MIDMYLSTEPETSPRERHDRCEREERADRWLWDAKRDVVDVDASVEAAKAPPANCRRRKAASAPVLALGAVICPLIWTYASVRLP